MQQMVHKSVSQRLFWG